ncbi:uncharacterized protein METZ01_LOCUS274738, partial [marine metagenome]
KRLAPQASAFGQAGRHPQRTSVQGFYNP